MTRRSDVTTGYAISGGAKLYFECAGSGPGLVFIHAGVSDSRMWDPQFDSFANRFRVVRYDHRGFGKSNFPDEPFSLHEDLTAVLHRVGISKATLVGCSMGGATAIDFALVHPEMVAALVLVGSGVTGLDDPKELSPDTIKHWTELIALVRKGDVDGAREMDARYWIDGPSRSSEQVDPAYRARARELHRENFSLERFTRREQTLQPPAIERLREIAAPTFVVIGENDSEDLVKLAGRFKAEIPRSRLATIKNAAHLPSLEHPEEFNALLSDFLNASP